MVIQGRNYQLILFVTTFSFKQIIDNRVFQPISVTEKPIVRSLELASVMFMPRAVALNFTTFLTSPG